MSKPANHNALATPVTSGASVPQVFRLLALAVLGFCVGTGCITNSHLLAGNSSAALQTARKEAVSELQCSQTTGSIESQEVVQGAPLGFLWTGYTVGVEGCGRQAVYTITCLDEEFCSADKL